MSEINKMTAFEELKERTTLEIIKEMCEMAGGETFDSDFINWLELHALELFDLKILFPLLLHRAVEGWNKDKKGEDCIIISDDNLILWRANLDDYKIYDFKNYQPCHLTPCEMAIWDCLLNILKQEERDE